MDSAPESQSRPSSPKVTEDENDASRSRRSSIVRSTESPTAVPLHFRRPPTSPAMQRSPSEGSAAVQPPDSPTQSRPRRPNSSEFVFSREIRPLWLVERHGVTNPEPQDENEPLPSRPSSTTSAANASVEDLTALPDEKRWETTDLSHHVSGDRPRELDLSSAQEYQHHGMLDSQQGTPTAGSFHASHSRPSSLRKEGSKPKYEFHSPSELLQDPTGFAALPPSPVMGALPSAVGSAVGGKDDEWEIENLPALPLSRPTTPESQSINPALSDVDTTPTQKRVAPARGSPEHSGLSGVVGDAMTAAAGLGAGVLAADKGIADESAETAQIGQTLVPHDGVPDLADLKKSAAPTHSDKAADEKTMAAENAGVSPEPDTHDKEALREIAAPQDTSNTTNEPTPVDTARAQEEPQTQLQQEDTLAETPTSASSKKKKKKDNKKKKNKSVDSGIIQESEIVPEPSAAEPAQLPEQDPDTPGVLDAVDLGNAESGKDLIVESATPDASSMGVSENDSGKALIAEPAQLPEQDMSQGELNDNAGVLEKGESERELDIGSTQPPEQEPPIPDATNTAHIAKDVESQSIQADIPENSVPDATTSKKSKRDKKKNKKKGKNATTEATAEESSAVETTAEERPAQSTEGMVESVSQESLPAEEPSGTTEDTGVEGKDLQLDHENTSADPTVSGPGIADVGESTREVSPPEPTTSTQEEDKPTADHPEPVPAESTPGAENREEQQDAGESAREDILGTNEKPVPLEQQDQPLEATVEEPSASPDQKDTAVETELHKEDGAANLEPETSLSRTSSKKKKKNKRKSAAEPETEPAAPSSQPESPAESGPGNLDEPSVTDETAETKQPDEVSAEQQEEATQEVPLEPVVDTTGEAEVAQSAESKEEASPEDNAGEQSSKKSKKKNKKKNKSISLTESQPETTPQQLEPGAQTSGELPPPAPAPAADVVASPPQPDEHSAANEESTKETYHDAIVEDALDNKPDTSLVESPEANDGPPHVLESPAVESVPEPDAGVSTPTGKKGKKDKKRKQQSLSAPDESSTVLTPDTADASADVPAAVEEPSSPAQAQEPEQEEPAREISTAPVEPIQASIEDHPQADLPAASEEPTVTAEPEPEPEQKSLEGEPSADNPSATEEPPASLERGLEREQSTENEPPVDPSEAPPEPAASEPAPPMTAAQKKKAKKDNKKKNKKQQQQQQQSVESVDEAPASTPVVEEPKTVEENVSETVDESSEQPKDTGLEDVSPIAGEELAKEAEALAEPADKESSDQAKDAGLLDTTTAAADKQTEEAEALAEPADKESSDQAKNAELLDTSPASADEQAKEAEALVEPADKESHEQSKEADLLDTATATAKEPPKEAEVPAEPADNERPEQPKDVDLDTTTIAADELPKEVDDSPAVVSEETASADINPAQTGEVDTPEPAGEPAKPGDAPESNAETASAETQAITADEESAKPDTEGATEQPAEQQNEKPTVQAEPTAGAEDISNADGEAAKAGSQDQVEEFQPASSSKSKKKNKKKKRQSLALEEESTTPVGDTPVAETPVAESETTTELPSEVSPETTQAPEQADQPQEKEKSPAVAEDTESTENTVSAEVSQEPQADQDQASETKEEPQPAVSKKKAKKDRKKRKSVSFAADDTPEQASEPAETREAVAQPEDTPPSETPKDEPAFQPREESLVTAPATEEPTGEAVSVSPEQSDPSITAEATEIPAEIASKEPKASEPVIAEGAEPVGQKSTEDEPETKTPSQENGITPPDTESLEETQDTTPVDTPEVGDQTLIDVPSEEPVTQELTRAPSPAATNEMSEPVSSESKKDKKKKKKKNKRNAVETSEDASAAVPEADVASENKEEPSNTPTATEDDSEAAVPKVKALEEDFPHAEDRPEAEEQSKEPVPEEKPQESESNPTEAVDSAPATLDPAAEEKKPEEIVEPPETLEDEYAGMSAKEKRKAKKKRRKSKGPDTTDESPTAEPSRGLSEDAPRSADAEPSETAPAPAEDDGKDNQSHGTDMHATNDEDLTWTDKMVSSQVEQQQEVNSPQSPSQLAPEQTDKVPSGEESRGQEPGDDKREKDQVTGAGVAELEEAEVSRGLDMQEGVGKVAEAGSEAVVESTGEEKEKEQGKDEEPSLEALPAATDKANESAIDVRAEREEEQLGESIEGPATQEQPPTSSDPAADEQEAPEAAAPSRKLSKKEKKKQRQAQKALLEAANPSEETSLLGEATAPESAAGQKEMVPGASQDVNVSPEKSVESKEIESSQVPVVESLTPAEGNERDVEGVLPTERELTEEKVALEAEPASTAEEAQETTVSPELTKEGFQISESQEPLAVTGKDGEPVEGTSLEHGQETAELTPEGKEIPSDPPGKANTEEVEPVKEEPALETLSRKESKKKKKKAKKQSKEQPEQQQSPSSGGDEKEVDPATTAPEVSAENAKVAIEDHPVDSPEQDQQRKPADNVDSFEAPPDVEGPEVNTSKEPQETPQDEAERGFPLNEEPRQPEMENGPEKEPAARAEGKEEGDATEAAPSPTEQLETAAPLTRKLSKKERKKAKQKAKQEVKEPEPEPEQEQAPLPEPEPGTHPATSTEEQPPVTETAPEPSVDEPSVSRTLSAKEKKKRKGRQTEQPEESRSLKTEVEPAQNEQGWPAIDIGWDKSKDNSDSTEQTPPTSPETPLAPFEPAIAEFDETAAPEGLQSLIYRGREPPRACSPTPAQQGRQHLSRVGARDVPPT